ncbi:oligosaccharide repeat unit polymerase [Limibaculum sp. FT325]|uniref:O-antigen polymerase n=1 Tax=Thermohalobaculum sediminis TaxID=2939436 RepID=UPI0020BFC2FE|nr:O-antigen polymerase [Limibaculum sediminis]MCL5776859.1 oligosaccharide repeat unit polymerase [Limibaculum sediminis]
MALSTGIICSAASFLILHVGIQSNVDVIFTETAQVLGGALALALLQEARSGLRQMVRADNLMLVSLYGLIFLEFLFPQQSFALELSTATARNGTIASLWGFFALTLGRHIIVKTARGSDFGARYDVPPRLLAQLFFAIAFFAYLHILLAVNFDIQEAIRQMALPRFWQAWARGSLGGWNTLLTEVGLLIFLVPPLAGLIFARFRSFRSLTLLFVVLIFAVTLFKGFADGTRSVFLIHLLTFTGAFILARPDLKTPHILSFGVVVATIGVLGMNYMLAFRGIGLSRFDFAEFESETLFVDLNLINICKLIEVFPSRFDYLGLEIPYWAMIRPIPRALWPGKPEGLSIGIEEALGVEGLTLSATFIGEAYMAGGLFGVIVTGLLLGATAGNWDRVGKQVGSNYGLILYCSGFFAAALSMRSVLQVAPALLPTLALWLFGRVWLRRVMRSRAQRPLREIVRGAGRDQY